MRQAITAMLAALFLIFLCVGSFATVTPVWNEPSSGTSYNNLPANARNVDLNFRVGDDNASVTDINVSLRYITQSGTATAIVTDANLNDWNANPTGTAYCDGSSSYDTMTCVYVWDMPENATMGDGDWFVDVNVVDVPNSSGEYAGANNSDGNSSRYIVVETSISSRETIISMMSTIGLVLAALVLIGGLTAIALFGADITSTAIVTIVAAIAVAIAANIIGIVMAAL